MEDDIETPEAPAEDATPITEGEAPSDQAPAPEAPSEGGWRDGIAEGPLLDQANRYTSVGAVVQATMDMRQKLSNAVIKPGDNATDEDRADFNEKMGVPTSTDDYQINLPEGLDASIVPTDEEQVGLKQSLEGMRAAGASQSVIDQGLALHYNAMQVQKQAEIEADTAYSKESMAILEKEWGADAKENKSIAANAASKLFGDNFENVRQIEMKDGRFLLDHPDMLRMLANIGREIGDSVLGGVVSDEQRASLKEKVQEVRQKKAEAMEKGNIKEANILDQQERDIYAQMG